MPISITAFVKTLAGTAAYSSHLLRAIGPLGYLARSPDFAIDVVGRDEVLAAGKAADALLDKDLCLFARQFSRTRNQAIVNKVHELGGQVVFDCDDDLTGRYHPNWSGDKFIEMLGLADCVTVATPGLASALAEYTKHEPIVLPNYIVLPWFAQESVETERVFSADTITVGLVGTHNHWRGDWQPVIEALGRLARDYPNVQPVIASGWVSAEVRQAIPRLAVIKPVSYAAYPGLVRQFDIVCCCLDPDDRFNQGKSSIKALESMAAARQLVAGLVGGAVPVCTDMPPYRDIVNGRNGLLVSNDQWYDALTLLVRDRRLRHRLGADGLEWVTEHGNMKREAHRWGDVYKELLAGQLPRKPRETVIVAPIRPPKFRLAAWLWATVRRIAHGTKDTK